ncbi:MAG: tetratricopeptide repeat protein [Limisphaerales bacterium]
MKMILLSVLMLSAPVSFLSFAQAQVTSSRALTRKIVPPKESPAPDPAPAPKPLVKPQVVAAPVPAKTEGEKAEILKKTVESQKKRAEEGSASAQYELGMRYFNGDGVGKNLELARQWLELSAQQGNAPAAKKLEALKKIAPAKIEKPTSPN